MSTDLVRAALARAKAENAQADALEAQAAKGSTPETRNRLRQAARRHREEALHELADARRHAEAP